MYSVVTSKAELWPQLDPAFLHADCSSCVNWDTEKAPPPPTWSECGSDASSLRRT